MRKWTSDIGDEMALLNLILLFRDRSPTRELFDALMTSFTVSRGDADALYEAFNNRNCYFFWSRIESQEQKLVAALLEANVSTPVLVRLLGALRDNPETSLADVCEIIRSMVDAGAFPVHLNDTALNVLLAYCLGMGIDETVTSVCQLYQDTTGSIQVEDIVSSYQTFASLPLLAGLRPA